MAHSARELRDRRLAGEYRQLMEFSDRSPLVTVQAVGHNMPPTEYMVTYNCKGYTDSSRRKITTGHKIHITLPSNYPQVPPIFQFKSNVWAPRFMNSFRASEHGNKVIDNYICIGHIGTPEIPLVNFVLGVGHMIQLQRDAPGMKPIDTRSLEGPDYSDQIVISETVDNSFFPGNHVVGIENLDITFIDDQDNIDDDIIILD